MAGVYLEPMGCPGRFFVKKCGEPSWSTLETVGEIYFTRNGWEWRLTFNFSETGRAMTRREAVGALVKAAGLARRRAVTHTGEEQA